MAVREKFLHETPINEKGYTVMLLELPREVQVIVIYLDGELQETKAIDPLKEGGNFRLVERDTSYELWFDSAYGDAVRKHNKVYTTSGKMFDLSYSRRNDDLKVEAFDNGDRIEETIWLRDENGLFRDLELAITPNPFNLLNG